MPASAATPEEIGIAAAKEIEAQVESRIGEPSNTGRLIRQLPQP